MPPLSEEQLLAAGKGESVSPRAEVTGRPPLFQDMLMWAALSRLLRLKGRAHEAEMERRGRDRRGEERGSQVDSIKLHHSLVGKSQTRNKKLGRLN